MAIKLEDAVAVVQKEIRDLRTKYESVAKMEEQDPILVEGRNFGRLFLPTYGGSKRCCKDFT